MTIYILKGMDGRIHATTIDPTVKKRWLDVMNRGPSGWYVPRYIAEEIQTSDTLNDALLATFHPEIVST